MSLLQSLGVRIQKIREKRRLTQEELGNKTGLNAKYISSIERGKKNATISTIARIADGLQIDIYELFLFSGEPESEETVRKALESLLKTSDYQTMSFCLDFLTKFQGTPKA